MIKVLSFDMDGTIIDTDEVLIKTWEELIKLYKPKNYTYDRASLAKYSGPSIEFAINDRFPEMNYDFILKEYRERTKKYYDTDMQLFPDCKEVLIKLKNEGFKLAIVTSKNKEMCYYSLKRYNILNLFDLIVTCEDVSKPKPDPEGILKVINYFKINNDEIIGIGDSYYDYKACANADVKCILMTMRPREYAEKNIKPLLFCSSYKNLYKELKKYEY